MCREDACLLEEALAPRAQVGGMKGAADTGYQATPATGKPCKSTELCEAAWSMPLSDESIASHHLHCRHWTRILQAATLSLWPPSLTLAGGHSTLFALKADLSTETGCSMQGTNWGEVFGWKVDEAKLSRGKGQSIRQG